MTKPTDSPTPHSSGRYAYRVRAHELGPREQTRLAALCHFLQESASLHAHELEASPAQLLKQDMTWFLARMRLRIEHYPRWRDSVTVETWPSEVAPPFVYRDFRVFDADEKEIAVASTSWLLMDMVKRRPMRRFPQSVVDLHPALPVRALSADPIRLPRLDEPEHVHRIHVRGSDLDINEHVNHVFYIDQIERAVPREISGQRQVAELEIEFKSECHAGDELTVGSLCTAENETAASRTAGTGIPYLHSLVRRRDSREVVRARTRWI